MTLASSTSRQQRWDAQNFPGVSMYSMITSKNLNWYYFSRQVLSQRKAMGLNVSKPGDSLMVVLDQPCTWDEEHIMLPGQDRPFERRM